MVEKNRKCGGAPGVRREVSRGGLLENGHELRLRGFHQLRWNSRTSQKIVILLLRNVSRRLCLALSREQDLSGLLFVLRHLESHTSHQTSWVKQGSRDTAVCFPQHFPTLPGPALVEEPSTACFEGEKHICVFMSALILCNQPKYLKIFLWKLFACWWLSWSWGCSLTRKKRVHSALLMTGVCTGHWLPANNGAVGNNSS